MGEKLTDFQIDVLEAMPKAEFSRFWGNGPGGLSRSARAACVRKGLIVLRHRGGMTLFELTQSGRAALNHRDQGEGSDG